MASPMHQVKTMQEVIVLKGYGEYFVLIHYHNVYRCSCNFSSGIYHMNAPYTLHKLAIHGVPNNSA